MFGDAPNHYKGEDRRRPTHRRTIIMSMLASGLVTIFLGGAIDKESCERTQADRIDTAQSLEKRADNILGNSTTGLKPADFSKPPYNNFKAFQALIVRNAEADRLRAIQYRKRIKQENCGGVPVVG